MIAVESTTETPTLPKKDIRFDFESRCYVVYVDGVLIGYAPNRIAADEMANRQAYAILASAPAADVVEPEAVSLPAAQVSAPVVVAYDPKAKKIAVYVGGEVVAHANTYIEASDLAAPYRQAAGAAPTPAGAPGEARFGATLAEGDDEDRIEFDAAQLRHTKAGIHIWCEFAPKSGRWSVTVTAPRPGAGLNPAYMVTNWGKDFNAMLMAMIARADALLAADAAA